MSNPVSLASPGSACDGETDAWMLVRQPVRSAHGSARQENRFSAVDHQGRQRLEPLFRPGAGTGAARRTESGWRWTGRLCSLSLSAWGCPLQDMVCPLQDSLRSGLVPKDRREVTEAALPADTELNKTIWTKQMKEEPYAIRSCIVYIQIILLPQTCKCPKLQVAHCDVLFFVPYLVADAAWIIDRPQTKSVALHSPDDLSFKGFALCCCYCRNPDGQRTTQFENCLLSCVYVWWRAEMFWSKTAI